MKITSFDRVKKDRIIDSITKNWHSLHNRFKLANVVDDSALASSDDEDEKKKKMEADKNTKPTRNRGSQTIARLFMRRSRSSRSPPSSPPSTAKVSSSQKKRLVTTKRNVAF